MTNKKILERIKKLIYESSSTACADPIDEYCRCEYGSPNYVGGFGEGSFPIRLSQKQAEEIYNFLDRYNIDYWMGDLEIGMINPKAVYRLWVNHLTVYMCEDGEFIMYYKMWWGLRRVTEDPADTTSGPHCRRAREM